MAKSINLEPTSKGINRMLDEMNATNVKLGETIDEYQYEEATSILLDKVNSIDPKLYQKSQDNDLATDNKTIVGAINELFQSASSGKQLIADAIGDDGIDEDSSFKAMSQAIRKLKTSTGSISGVKQIENNNENFFVLKSSGELYGCGRNANGELGLGDTDSRLELTLIQEDVETVYCGDYSTYIIKAEGDVYSCGKNDKGQLGIGNTSNALEFTLIPDITNVKQIAGGPAHTLLVKNDGSLYACGSNESKQLGVELKTGWECTNPTNEHTILEGDEYGYWVLSEYSYFFEYEDNNFSQSTPETCTIINRNEYPITIVLTEVDDDMSPLSDYRFEVPANSFYKKTGMQSASATDYVETCLLTIDFYVSSGWSKDVYTKETIQDALRNISVYAADVEVVQGIANETPTFTQVTDNINYDVKQVACGRIHSAILKDNDTVWTCGQDTVGQLAQGGTEYCTKFTKVENVDDSIEYYLLEEEATFSNKSGYWTRTYPGLKMASDSNIKYSVAWDGSGDFYELTDNGDNTFVFDSDNSQVESRAWGTYMTLDITYDPATNTTVVNGYAGSFMLNPPSDFILRIRKVNSSYKSLDSVSQISSGRDHMLLLTNDGKVYACGDNSKGQLGIYTSDNKSIFTISSAFNAKQVECGDYSSFIVLNDNSVMSCGEFKSNNLCLFSNPVNSSAAMDYQDIFGSNDIYVNLNYNHIRFTSAANIFAVGGTYTFVNNTDRVISWTITDTPGNEHVFDIDAGSYLTTTVASNVATGDITGYIYLYPYYGWDLNNAETERNIIKENVFVIPGAVDFNRSIFSPTSLTNVKAITSDNTTTFVLDKNDSLFGCGINKYGQLGLNNTANQMDPVLIKKFESGTYKDLLYSVLDEKEVDVKASMDMADLINEVKKLEVKEGDIKKIACGIAHAVVLKSDGSLWSCGYNNDGELGLGDTTTVRTFTQVTTNIDNDVIDIDCGDYHTVAIKKDGTVWVTGDNQYSQLGISSVSNVTEFTQISDANENVVTNAIQVGCGHYTTMIVKKDGTLWGVGYDGVGSLGMGTADTKYKLTQVTNNINKDVKKVFCGDQHTIILKTDNSVWGTGRNLNGQLGLGHTTDTVVFTKAEENVKEVACGKFFTFIIKNDGTVWSCGRTDNGQTGHDTQMTVFSKNDIKDAKKVACGDYHTMIVKKDGTLWAIGDNYNGQLGTGDQSERSAFTQITNGINNDAKSVACGTNSYFTYVIKKDDTIMATGDNSYGQLGQDNTSVTISLKKVILPKPNALDPNSALSLDWLGTQEPVYFVSDIEGAEYGFTFNGTSYESTNQGKHSTAAVCRLYIHNPTGRTAYLYCVNYGESNYDYGLISNKNTTLDLSYNADADSKLLKSFKGQQSASEVTITLPEGSGWYYIKYRKDGSDNANYDSLSFRVGFSAPYANQSLDEPIIYTDTPKE